MFQSLIVSINITKTGTVNNSQ